MKQIFAVIGKMPVEGYSKTRLAADVGVEQAYELYEAFIADFFASYRKNTSNALLYFYGAPAIRQTKEYFQLAFLKNGITNFEFYFQKERPFFERLADIYEDVRFRIGGETFVHLTGTDIPDFPFSYLKKINIDEADVLIGPDSDGGFYYLGSKAKNDEIFEFAKTMQEGQGVLDCLTSKCEALGLKVKLLNKWSDIDTINDLKTCIKRSSSDIIPQTSECFTKLSSSNDL